MKCSLSVTSLMNHAPGVLSKKSFLHSRLSRCSCMLPPRSFIVLYFTFRSVIHFELIFVKGVRSRFSFFFCRRCQIVLTPFVEKLFFLNAILCSFVKDQLTIFMGVYFQIRYSVPFIYLFVLLSISHSLDYHSFMCCAVLSHCSHVQFCANVWTEAHRALLFMGLSRQEYWSGLPYSPLGDLSDPGIKLVSLMSPCIGRWVLFFFFSFILLVGGSLLYNIIVVFAIH